MSEMEWYCEAVAIGLDHLHCSPEKRHDPPCGWRVISLATESSVSPACVVPHHWHDEIIGGTHDGGLPEDPRTPCMGPEDYARFGSGGVDDPSELRRQNDILRHRLGIAHEVIRQQYETWATGRTPWQPGSECEAEFRRAFAVTVPDGEVS